MNASQKAALPAGLELELPVLTDVVEEVTLPVLSEEPPFELPDFDFSSELDDMATALPTDAGMVELDIPAELPLEVARGGGPAAGVVEPVVDFSNLPSLDLDVAALDELALDDVLPGLARGALSLQANELSAGTAQRGEPFDFVLSPADSSSDAVVSGASEQVQTCVDDFAIPELTMELSEPPISVETEAADTVSSLLEPVELLHTEPAQGDDDGFAIPELTMEWLEPPVSVEEGVVGAAPSALELVELQGAESTPVRDEGLAIPELTMGWSEPPVSVKTEAADTVSSLPEPVELQSTEPAQVCDDGFAIPELTMEWSEAPVSASVEEVGTASSEPAESPASNSMSSLAENDAVVAEATAAEPETWAGAIPVLNTAQADGLAEQVVAAFSGMTDEQPEPVAGAISAPVESADLVAEEAVEAVRAVPAMQSIDIESLPTGVLGGGVGPEPVVEAHDRLSWGATEFDSPTTESPEAMAAALSELAALLEPVVEATPAEPAVSLALESREAEVLPVTEVSPPVSGSDDARLVDETMLFDEPDQGGQPGQAEVPEVRIVVPELLPPTAAVEQAAAVHVEPSVESEGAQEGLTFAIPALAEAVEPADVMQEPLGMAGDQVGVFAADSAADSGRLEVPVANHVTPDLGEVPAVTGIEPADVVVPLVSAMDVEKPSKLAAVSQLDKGAGAGLPDPSVTDATSAVGAIEPLAEAGEPSCTVVDEQALIDSLTQKILPRMKVELSLWLQDALEMQARQMLSGVMHQLKEDYEMLFNETLRESLRQAITEIGRDEREGKS